MLPYALLMAMLYGGENKNLKTVLIMVALLAYLGNPRDRRRRRRGRRRVNNRSLLDTNDDVDKTELILAAVQSVLNYINISSQAKKNLQTSEEHVIGEGNAGREATKERAVSQQPGRGRNNDEMNREVNPRHGTRQSRVNRAIPPSSDENQSPAVDIAENRRTESRRAENNLPAERRLNSSISHNTQDDNREVSCMKKKDITEVIKEIYHGVNISGGLSNGKTATGEVVGVYEGILILRDMGMLNYISGEAIVNFS